MATITAITRQYAKAVFIDHSRTLNSVPASQKEGVVQYAGTSTQTPNTSPQIYMENINAALAAETITQVQYDDLLATYPDIPNRPVYGLSAAAVSTEGSA